MILSHLAADAAKKADLDNMIRVISLNSTGHRAHYLNSQSFSQSLQKLSPKKVLLQQKGVERTKVALLLLSHLKTKTETHKDLTDSPQGNNKLHPSLLPISLVDW